MKFGWIYLPALTSSILTKIKVTEKVAHNTKNSGEWFMFDIFKPEKFYETVSLEEAREVIESRFPYIEPHETTLDQIRINDKGSVVVEEVGDFLMTKSAFAMLNAIVGIPYSYAKGIDKDLWLTNFNAKTLYNKKPVWISTSIDDKEDTYIIAFSKDNKNQARDKDILGLFDDSTIYEGKMIRLWDSGMQTAMILKQEAFIEPVVGDVSNVGLKVVNSQVGKPSAKIEAMTFRLICSNGAILGESFGRAYWPSDKRLKYSASFAAFEREFLDIAVNVDFLQELYNRSTEKRLTVREIVSLWRRVERVVQSREVADIILRLGDKERTNYIQDERDRQMFEKKNDDEVTSPLTPLVLYETFNRITAHARDVSDFSISYHLEQIAGSALTFGAAKAA